MVVPKRLEFYEDHNYLRFLPWGTVVQSGRARSDRDNRRQDVTGTPGQGRGPVDSTVLIFEGLSSVP